MAETYLNHFNVDCHRNTGSNTGKNGGVMVYKNDPWIKEFYSENSRVLLQGQKNNFIFYLAHHWLLRSNQRSAVAKARFLIKCEVNLVWSLRFFCLFFLGQFLLLDYKFFQNSSYFGKFHNIRFIFVNAIFEFGLQNTLLLSAIYW